MTTEPSNDARSSWSRDSRWIYFRSNRSGSEQIWKMPSEGGAAVQITRGGAIEGFESPDGKLLYFAKSWGPDGIWSVPVDGGPENCVIAGARPNIWAVADPGIYFADPDAARGGPVPLMLYRFENGRISQAAVLKKAGWALVPSLSVTRDGRRVAWVQVDRDEAKLMLIDNFR